jgi:hypothetical protein
MHCPQAIAARICAFCGILTQLEYGVYQTICSQLAFVLSASSPSALPKRKILCVREILLPRFHPVPSMKTKLHRPLADLTSNIFLALLKQSFFNIWRSRTFIGNKVLATRRPCNLISYHYHNASAFALFLGLYIEDFVIYFKLHDAHYFESFLVYCRLCFAL